MSDIAALEAELAAARQRIEVLTAERDRDHEASDKLTYALFMKSTELREELATARRLVAPIARAVAERPSLPFTPDICALAAWYGKAGEAKEGRMLSDTEVIFEFMAPTADARVDSDLDWWGQKWECGKRVTFTYPLSLDRLHLVEEQLTEDQWWSFLGALHKVTEGARAYAYRHLIHATAEQKLAALAAVLRPVVEGEMDAKE